jgi:hypothetical protein
MDIKLLQAQVAQDDTPVTIPIYQKDGDPYLAADGTPATIDVVGNESKKYRLARLAVQKQMLRSRRTRVEPEDLQRNRIALAAAAVTGWHGWEADGKALEASPENVRALLSVEHILDQVEAGVSLHADFFKQNSSS